MAQYKDGMAEKTIYKNIWFESKLEARWAVFFDALNIHWEYEPFHSEVNFCGGLAEYEIDFFLKDIGVYIEVKPFDRQHFPFGVIEKARGWAEDYGDVLILVGQPAIVNKNSTRHYLLCYSQKFDRVFTQDKMWWCRCPRCGRVGISPEGGVPVDCRRSCFKKGPTTDMFGEDLDEPQGHLDKTIKDACRTAKYYFDLPKRQIAKAIQHIMP